MRKTFTRVAIALLTAVTVTPTAIWANSNKAPSLKNLKINGVLTYDNDRDVNLFGVYSYNAIAPVAREKVTGIRAIAASGGIAYDNGKLYAYDYSISYGYVMSSNYYVYDATTGEQLSTKSIGYDVATVYAMAATANTKDLTTGTHYACSYVYDDASQAVSYVLSKWNLEDGTKEAIAPLASPLRVMACDSQGQLYGITMTALDGSGTGGNFVKIDKATGEETVLGTTGVNANRYYQSAVIDTNNDTFYWFSVDDNEAANLYTVSLTDGSVTLIGALPNGDQVQGAYMPAAEAADGAPSPAENLTAIFAGSSLQGKIAFDVPSETYSGEALSGDINYTITANGTVLAEGQASAGSNVVVDAAVNEAAEYEIIVVLSNQAGNSPKASTSLYIGPDTPVSPSNVTATKDGQVINITWVAPTKGIHDADIDANDLTYTITRQPSGDVVASNVQGTSYADNFSSETLQSIYYEVVANNGDLNSQPGVSGKVLVGESVALPYSQDFTDENSLDLFTIIDANADNSAWAYYRGTARYRANYNNDADDWLILPPVKLQKGFSYDLQFDANGSNSRYTNNMTVAMGNSATAAAMTTILKEGTYVGTTVTTEKITITPEADGIYYIGMHVTSPAAQGNLSIDNLSISAPKSDNVPAHVNNLNVVPGENGALNATISFESPATTAKGEELTELTALEISRNGEKIHTITPASATATQYTYTDLDAQQGENIYSVVAVNSQGVSEAANDTVWVGIDTPLAPQAFSVVDNGDGTAVATWQAVGDTGANGGYVNTNDVTYTIYDANGSVIATDIYDTSFTITGLNSQLPQVVTSFAVAAKNVAGESLKTNSDEVLVGPSLAIPFSESFAQAEYANTPWTTKTLAGKSYNGRWALRNDADHNNDGAGADFQGYEENSCSRLQSPKIDISTAKRPVLTFFANIPTGGAVVTVEVSVNGGQWQEIKTIENVTEWTAYNIDLSQFNTNSLRIGFKGLCTAGYNFAYIDEIKVEDQDLTNINSIVTDDNDITIYNMNGVLVGNSLDNLTPGIYIIKSANNIKKVLVK